MGSTRARVGRGVLAALVMFGFLTFLDFGSSPAEAGDKVCGYVKYDTDGGPTSTASSVPYCETPCGSAVAGGTGPIDVFDLYAEAFVCVRPFA